MLLLCSARMLDEKQAQWGQPNAIEALKYMNIEVHFEASIEQRII